MGKRNVGTMFAWEGHICRIINDIDVMIYVYIFDNCVTKGGQLFDIIDLIGPVPSYIYISEKRRCKSLDPKTPTTPEYH